jgi:diacylglycerol kinase (ATP)
MTSVAVVAHRKKTLGGGLPELRRLLNDRGVDQALWCEVSKSRDAPAQVRNAMKKGVDLILLWGGDGTVQRGLDALASSAASEVAVGIIPAGTANLLAGNLGIPTNLEEAVRIALDGDRRALDLGVVNHEHFAVMAGTGLDALMMKEADAGLKDRLGQLAYFWTGIRAIRARSVSMSVMVDGTSWFNGQASCLLVGNMGRLTGGLVAFPDARSDDGQLEIGVVRAATTLQWARVAVLLLRGAPGHSKLVHMGRGRKISVKLDRELPYELDGGARTSTKKLRVRVAPRAVTVCVPEADGRP